MRDRGIVKGHGHQEKGEEERWSTDRHGSSLYRNGCALYSASVVTLYLHSINAYRLQNKKQNTEINHNCSILTAQQNQVRKIPSSDGEWQWQRWRASAISAPGVRVKEAHENPKERKRRKNGGHGLIATAHENQR
jgi:hypothetical protein